MVDATIHLDEHPEAELDIDLKPDGRVALHVRDAGGIRVTIWMKQERAIELADLIEFTLSAMPLVAAS